MPGPAVLTLELPNRAAAAGAARNALTSLNGSLHLVSEARLPDVQLLTTELVANAFRHSGAVEQPVRLTVHASDDVLRVEVHDHGKPWYVSAPEPPVPGQIGGYGLHLVDTLATRWGVEDDEGTVVWFEVDRPGKCEPMPASSSSRRAPLTA
jgi:anti-sigma regulatory factor (Ser/Thr protein kinase)